MTVGGRGTNLDLAPGELLTIGDSQFSYFFLLCAQLATNHNICSLLLVLDSYYYLKGCDC